MCFWLNGNVLCTLNSLIPYYNETKHIIIFEMLLCYSFKNSSWSLKSNDYNDIGFPYMFYRIVEKLKLNKLASQSFQLLNSWAKTGFIIVFDAEYHKCLNLHIAFCLAMKSKTFFQFIAYRLYRIIYTGSEYSTWKKLFEQKTAFRFVDLIAWYCCVCNIMCVAAFLPDILFLYI